LALRVADTLELTRVHREYPGDIRFPEYDSSQWARVAEESHEGLDRVSGSAVRFSYETYRRRG
jgi:dihydrofolate reductase